MARMKKAKTGTHGSAAKGRVAPKSVDEYLSRIPEPALSTLKKIRAAIRSAAPPDATEVISYGIPAFKHKQVLMWYAAFSKHCSLFPTGAIIEKFKEELAGCTISKGTVQFPTDKPLSTALIKKMVKARVALIESKKKS
jgi:uncharacterized protein YdhG (YjbR/CyaY superfamily)